MVLPELQIFVKKKWSRVEELFFEESTTPFTKMSFLFLPIILVASWQIFVFWTLGLNGWWTSLFGITLICVSLALISKKLSFNYFALPP